MIDPKDVITYFRDLLYVQQDILDLLEQDKSIAADKKAKLRDNVIKKQHIIIEIIKKWSLIIYE